MYCGIIFWLEHLSDQTGNCMCQPQKYQMFDCSFRYSYYEYVTFIQISSLKRVKRELESKIEELEDELDEVTVRSESLEQVC